MKLENQLLMSQYIKLTEFLGRLLGRDYEIVLHDLSDKDHSIVAIANNFISKRQVGGPITNVALQIISDKSYLSSDFRTHYGGVSQDGRRLASSTMFIKNSQNELIGLLCINFDDSRYRELSEKLVNLRTVDQFLDSNFQYNESMAVVSPPSISSSSLNSNDPIETFYNSTDEVAKEVANQTILELGTSTDNLTTEEKITIVEKMHSRGVFLLKGGVKEAAEVLGCSQATIYRYLSDIKEKEKNRG